MKQQRLSLFSGASKLAKTVGSTLGPGGRNVILQSHPNQQDSFLSLDTPFKPCITKDGVTVAKSLQVLGNNNSQVDSRTGRRQKINSQMETIGAKLIADAAERTNEECGDGTTTSTVIAHGILKQGIKALQYGQINPVELRKGIQKTVDAICKQIDKMSKQITIQDNLQDIYNIAYISSNGDSEMADQITQIHQKIGLEGAISIQEGKGHIKTEVKYIDGYSLDSGYLSPYFADTQKKDSQIDYENGVYVVTIDQVISNSSGRDCLEDIAVLTGAKLLSPELGYNQLDRIDPVYVLGKCFKIQIDKKQTVIIKGEGKQSLVDDRVQLLQDQLQDNIMLGDFDKEKLQERIAKFKGGIAIIQAGGRTEFAMNECRDRIEDAVHAVRAALEEGIVIGGGCALLYASQLVKNEVQVSNREQEIGRDIVIKCCELPLQKIYSNANLVEEAEGGFITEKLKEINDHSIGYDGKSKEITNLLDKNIIDPAKVVKCALRYGAGLASILLTAECAVLFSKYSPKQLEYDLYKELKSPPYQPFIEAFANLDHHLTSTEINIDPVFQTQHEITVPTHLPFIEYPKISIEYCSPMRKLVFIKNPAVTYDFDSNTLRLCKNHVHSKQVMMEDFRRENMLAYDYIIEKRDLRGDLDRLAQSFIRACKAEYMASEANPRTQQKLVDNNRGMQIYRAAKDKYEPDEWPQVAKEVVQRNHNAVKSQIPFKSLREQIKEQMNDNSSDKIVETKYFGKQLYD
eukprot:403338030